MPSAHLVFALLLTIIKHILYNFIRFVSSVWIHLWLAVLVSANMIYYKWIINE